MYMDSFFWGGGFDALFFFMFFLIFGIIIVMMIVTCTSAIRQWNTNNRSPRLTVEADVVAKRTDVSYHHHHHSHEVGGAASGSHTTASTSYYVTFQVESGDRMELYVNGSEYGMLAEGDHGRLSFQGTRYLGFERI